MKSLKNVTSNKPSLCGASIQEARAAVDLLTQQEQLQLLAMLEAEFPGRVPKSGTITKPFG